MLKPCLNYVQACLELGCMFLSSRFVLFSIVVNCFVIFPKMLNDLSFRLMVLLRFVNFHLFMRKSEIWCRFEPFLILHVTNDFFFTRIGANSAWASRHSCPARDNIHNQEISRCVYRHGCVMK